MQQGKVLVWMPVLLGLYGLLELGHHRLKGVLLVEPMGKQMHADKRQPRHNLDERSRRLRFFFESSLGAVALSRD